MKDGSPYDKDKDPLYDPDAPDWEQFDRPRYYYDEDDEDEDDEDDDNEDEDNYEDDDFSDNKKDSASDWIYRGIGFGLANSILSGGASSYGQHMVSPFYDRMDRPSDNLHGACRFTKLWQDTATATGSSSITVKDRQRI